MVNIDPADKPLPGKPNQNKYRQPIADYYAGMQPHVVVATGDPHKVMFTSFLRGNRGLWTLQVMNDDPNAFKAKTDSIPMTFGPYIEKGFDLNIQNARSVAVLPSLEYGRAVTSTIAKDATTMLRGKRNATRLMGR